MSAYTGKTISWDMALKSKQVLMPESLDFDMKLPEPAVAIPGKTEFI
jgi:myo-inositol 2-dehydrogenase / D-chiro-inositol 1-dehydrogenase